MSVTIDMSFTVAEINEQRLFELSTTSILPDYQPPDLRTSVCDFGSLNVTLTAMRHDIHQLSRNVEVSVFAQLKSSNEQKAKVSEDIKALSARITPIERKLDLNILGQAELEDKCAAMETKTSTLSTEVNQLKEMNIRQNSEIVAELEERRKRECNVLILGCAETNASEAQAQLAMDREAATQILSTIVADISPGDVIRLHRLGRKQQGKIRPLKVTLSSARLTRQVLGKAKSAPAGIKIACDRTPNQQAELTLLRGELAQRQADDPNLTIRYINSVPKIVKRQGNGSRQQFRQNTV